MSIMEERIIYISKVKCPKCWAQNLGYYTEEILTYIRARKIGCMIFYKIIQGIPLIPKPYYNGEYSTNNNLKSIAKLEKVKARIYITEFKEKLKKSKHESRS